MAAPADKSLQNLSGKWTMNKSLSTPVEMTLKIQGFSSLTRGAISHAPVHLKVSHPSDSEIKIKQSTTASIPAVDEEWTLDWTSREKKDTLMGLVRSRSRSIASIKEIDNEAEDGEFLGSGWEEEEKGREMVEAFVEGVDGGWSAHQVWGFEEVDGSRRFVRRVVVRGKDGEREDVRIVYDWDGE